VLQLSLGPAARADGATSSTRPSAQSDRL
jgi:hypothetical protein